jgi:hypothetical protein
MAFTSFPVRAARLPGSVARDSCAHRKSPNVGSESWKYFSKIDRRAGSALRLSIDRAFRREGITIPLPQRDVHVRSGGAGFGWSDPLTARRLGIQGVRFFVLGGNCAVSGAQPPSPKVECRRDAHASESEP